jgi:uncharacterized protein (DUF302 family)
MSGVVVIPSSLSYEAAVVRLIAAIEERGLAVLARVDHAAGARAAGLELASEEVVFFGNPTAGTPLMQSDPRVGIELPLRMLVWQDQDGTRFAYRDPRKEDVRIVVELRRRSSRVDGQTVTGSACS